MYSKKKPTKSGFAKYFRNADAPWSWCIGGLIGGFVLSDIGFAICNSAGFNEIFKNGAVVVRNPLFWIGLGSGPARWTSVGVIAFKEKCYSYDPLTPELLRSILCYRPRSRLVSDAMMRGFFFHAVVVQVLWRFLKNPADRDALAMWRMVQESNMVDEVGAGAIERLCHAYYDDPQRFDKTMCDHTKEGYENILSNIENKAWPILDSMLNGDVSWVQDNKLAFRMLYYMSSQRMRSLGFVKMVSSARKHDTENLQFIRGGLYRRHIIALDSAAHMMQMRPLLEFRILTVKDGAELITGDFPVINLGLNKSGDYYFPLSPKRGLLFGPKESFNERNARYLKGDRDSTTVLN